MLQETEVASLESSGSASKIHYRLLRLRAGSPPSAGPRLRGPAAILGRGPWDPRQGDKTRRHVARVPDGSHVLCLGPRDNAAACRRPCRGRAWARCWASASRALREDISAAVSPQRVALCPNCLGTQHASNLRGHRAVRGVGPLRDAVWSHSKSERGKLHPGAGDLGQGSEAAMERVDTAPRPRIPSRGHAQTLPGARHCPSPGCEGAPAVQDPTRQAAFRITRNELLPIL